MESTEFIFIRNALDDIYRKLANVEAEVQALRTDISFLKSDSNAGGSFASDLRAEFNEFKNQWNSDSPDLHGLKENLLKLKNSLSGLAQTLEQPTNEASKKEESGG